MTYPSPAWRSAYASPFGCKSLCTSAARKKRRGLSSAVLLGMASMRPALIHRFSVSRLMFSRRRASFMGSISSSSPTSALPSYISTLSYTFYLTVRHNWRTIAAYRTNTVYRSRKGKGHGTSSRH